MRDSTLNFLKKMLVGLICFTGTLLMVAYSQSTWLQREIFHIKDSIARKSYEFGETHRSYQPLTDVLAKLTMPLPENFCEEKKANIAFIRTHKTGSRTVQNILFRAGIGLRAKFGLPSSSKVNRFGYPDYFNSKFVRMSKNGDEKFNMILHQMRFDYNEVSKVVKADTKYVTIMRDPTHQFDSIYTNYYDTIKSFPSAPRYSLEGWLDHAPKNFIDGANGGGYLWQLAKSATFFDLGYDSISVDELYVSKSISEIENHMDLVMVTEYFDESLILLKDMMCWNLEDVVYVKLNVRFKRPLSFSKRLRKKARNWNKADAMLYDHFNRTLWEKISTYGHLKLSREVETLRSLNSLIIKECFANVDRSDKLFVKTGRKIEHPPSVDIIDYELRDGARDLCQKIIMSEEGMTNFLLHK